MANPWDKPTTENNPWDKPVQVKETQPEQGNIYTQSAQDIQYSPEGIPLNTSSYGSENPYKRTEKVLTTAVSLPLSFATGAAKPIAGAVQLGNNLLGNNQSNLTLSDLITGNKPKPKMSNGDNMVNAINQMEQGFQTQGVKLPSQIASIAGQTLPFLRAGGAPTVMNQALTGAAMGLTNPEETGLSPEEFRQRKGVNTAISTVAGGVSPLVVGAIGRVISPKLTPDIEKLVQSGVNLTPGQIMGGALRNIEDKLTSVPLLGDAINYSRRKGVEEFNKAAYKQVLEPIGGKVPNVTGREGIEVVEKQLNDAYEKILPNITFKATPEFNTNIANLRSMVSGLGKDAQTLFNSKINNIIGSKLAPKTGMMDGIAFKQAESELGTLAKNYGSSAIASEREIGNAFLQAQVELRNALKATNPQAQAELSNINKGWANFTRLQAAGSKANTAEMFTPAQLAQGVRQMDKSVRKGAVARGNALMQDLSDAGVNVLPSKVPDSGTAGRLLTGGIIGGGAHYLSPELAIGAGSLALPYLPGARQAMTTMMAKRPESAKLLAEQLRQKQNALLMPSIEAMQQGE
jgi:hypothetical protein